MSTENRSRNTDPHHDDDKKVIVEQHRQYLKLTDGNWMDEASAFQDQAYALGRARGKIEGAQPAPQPHPDPIAWMVGTAFWWTKEEAERDAAETGLQIVGLGPMANNAEVEHLRGWVSAYKESRERLHDWLREEKLKNISLRAQLAEAQALLREIHDGALSGFARYSKIEEFLSASAEPSAPKCGNCAASTGNSCNDNGCGYLEGGNGEPSAPVEIDERAEFEQACREAAIARGRELDPEALRRRTDGSHVNPLTECGWWGWQARAALNQKPS